MLHRELMLYILSAGATVMMFGHWFPPYGRCLARIHCNGVIEWRKKSPPFMNSELRRAVYKKKMLFNKHIKYKGKTNWENIRKQRNYVTKLRKQSIKLYFFERCSCGPKVKGLLVYH